MEVSGIDGVTVGTFGIDRVSDTEVTIELEFDGNIDTDATLTFTVGADAIAGYNGPSLTVQIPVTATTEAEGSGHGRRGACHGRRGACHGRRGA